MRDAIFSRAPSMASFARCPSARLTDDEIAMGSLLLGMKEMIAGGGEEFSATQVAIFDTLYATSLRNDAPKTTPAPYDADRDGLVIGDGAATFVLEELEHKLELLREAVATGSDEEVLRTLHNVIPTYRYPEEVNNTKADLREMAGVSI